MACRSRRFEPRARDDPKQICGDGRCAARACSARARRRRSDRIRLHQVRREEVQAHSAAPRSRTTARGSARATRSSNVLLSAGDQRMYVSLRPVEEEQHRAVADLSRLQQRLRGHGRVAHRASAQTARRGPSPPSCAGTWSPPTIARRRPARSRAPAACWWSRGSARRRLPCRLCRCARQSGRQRACAQDRRRERAHFKCGKDKRIVAGKVSERGTDPINRCPIGVTRDMPSSASRTRPYRGSWPRSVRTSARPRGRRAPCRNRPPARCRRAPRSPGSSIRSAPDRAAPP